MRERFDAPYWVVHRADLQTVLLDAVRSEPAIRLAMGRTVETVEDGPTEARLTWISAGGARDTIAVDMIVGADGIWSKVRQALGDGRPPAFRGSVAWRATLDRSAAPAELSGDETGLWLGLRGHVVHYPIAGGRLVNVVAIERSPTPVEGWAAPGNRDELLAGYASAAPALRTLLSQPREWLRWSLFDHPAERLATGRVALLGDAAHPVLPFLAQGAALAVEDAATLAFLLGRHRPDIPQTLAAYEKQRLARANRVQKEARRNGRIYHAGGLVGFGRNQVMRHLGPEGMTRRYDWLYGFRSPA
jgi:salicylate hydroxylase